MEDNEKIYTPLRIKEERESLAKTILLPAIGFAIFAVAFYWLTTSLENGTGPHRINWLAYVVYESLGRIKGTITLAVISTILFVVYAIKMILLQKKINNQIT
jgi:hypothetical protein